MATTEYRPELSQLDLIGDIHGCYDELLVLLDTLGYQKDDQEIWRHSEGRTLVFLGDICDRGPKNAEVFALVYAHWKLGEALWVQGNHDNKMFRWMKGNAVKQTNGLAETVTQLEARYSPEEILSMGQDLFNNVPLKIEFNRGNLVACHAFPGMDSRCLYGPRDPVTSERLPWWESHPPEAPFVVFGHYWLHEIGLNWACIDGSGCRGGQLIALRWGSKEAPSFVYAEVSTCYYTEPVHELAKV